MGIGLRVQEEYKRILKKMIDHAKDNKINDSEQLIQALIKELKQDMSNRGKSPYKPLKF